MENSFKLLKQPKLFVWVVVFSNLLVFADTLKMRELYNKDLSYSNLAKELQGKYIQVSGFMAPPLKAESKFFVLTKIPLSVCPFCETEAEWPDDILAIYTKRVNKVVPFNVKIKVTGILELGTFTDEETGFVSKIRIVNAKYE